MTSTGVVDMFFDFDWTMQCNNGFSSKTLHYTFISNICGSVCGITISTLKDVHLIIYELGDVGLISHIVYL